LAESLSSTSSAPFGDCKSAELHRIDQVQSFGGLIAIDKRTQRICACSANIARFTGQAPQELLGQPSSRLFKPDQLPSLAKAADVSGQHLPHLQAANLQERALLIASHAVDQVTLVEMEDYRSEPVAFDFADRVAYLQALAAADTPEGAARLLMNAVADISAYDRVLLYKFLPDWHGEVVAESLRPGVSGFLGLRFPATDLPANARRLYGVNWQRTIADVHAATEAVIRTPDCPSIDFSFSQLRAVHPAHIQYLKNIGVEASFSLSVMVGPQLWGLVVCHHLTPKSVSFEQRQLCEELARTTGIHMTGMDALQRERQRAALHARLAEVLGAMRAQNGDKRTIVSQLKPIRETFRASGIQAQLDGTQFHSGDIPDEATLRALRDSLQTSGTSDASAVAARRTIIPTLAGDPAAVRFASGSLLIALNGPDFLLLLRPEQVETVTWAGRPQADAGAEVAALTPRASFDAWSEQVKGTADPWEGAELEAAAKLRELMLEYAERRQLETLALLDPLTGLANRLAFEKSLQEAIRLALKDDTLAAVFVLDLDKFKAINDMMGHAAGDEVLIQVGQRLTAMMRARDTVARLGGDEFGVVGFHLWKADDAHRTAERIIREIHRPFIIQGQPIELGASIGVSICPVDAIEPGELLEQADLALYTAKRAGRNTFKSFSNEMRSAAGHKESVRNGLIQAMQDGSLYLVYQPMVSSKTRALQSFETFARWRHPLKGELTARDFLPLIEQCQLLAPFAKWGIREVLKQGKKWLREAAPLVPVSLNLSARQFLSLDLVNLCGSIARELDIGLRWLRFDLEETALQADFPHAAHKIAALSELGVLINVDHFGQGLVPLNRICDVKLNQLNVAGKYFDSGAEMQRNDALLAITREVGRVLGVPIVATQIESEAMALRATGADIEYLQGNLIAPALEAAAVEGWLRGRVGPEAGRDGHSAGP
jgi:diguanylate cyclase (GGDEF)-like protein